ncbi:hypothetical protein CFP56_015075 [Quercus suber]|uniref:Uncharacterized protein n=1 Tax=Quercus suber TaxID=58331 RepID=A0AAW0KQN8_QUESU
MSMTTTKTITTPPPPPPPLLPTRPGLPPLPVPSKKATLSLSTRKPKVRKVLMK